MKLLVFNNLSKASTVLSAFLDVASKELDEIIVVFPRAFDTKSAYGQVSENVKFVFPSKGEKLFAILTAVFSLISFTTIKDFLFAIRKKKLSVGYIKAYIKTVVGADLLYCTGKKYIDKEKGNISVLSTWYSHNAIAAAKVKKNNPEITAFSYAHSYEVDFRKNNYTAVIRDTYKEKYLDKVFFISETVMKEYVKLNSDILAHTEKYESLHFGSRKKCDGQATASDDGVFRIVTCSGVNPVKRLDVFAQALKLYNGATPIEWTLMGDGSQLEQIKDVASAYKNNVKVVFKGRVSNDDVHKYYANEKIDLFVNVSLSEGLPVSIMEAMSYSIPTLATAAGGNHEIVTDKTGYPISLDISPESLCKDITDIVENWAICKEKRAEAYHMWSSSYRIEENVAKLLERLK